ncbi:2-succinyl-6-hydroxy-2,4-cyclohexadiene-1-carboxylate synthase [Sporolactobacillus shoreicorticis]|uniref:Putative 2-succinyl-6-hydroxy-2,4-cyclohexadiene-1-carboxylate synthase n=1 Tax=Sporolactobacillus shoreicorticis TaxID=1923877 RepID=A0ABW5S7C6_9BACL|nr:2-succinyl-6-hydroxy-2,4-cyclohexadiene-1-carboxylate synthase [Sporolactobacillus shoreicorticis]MCO7125727.1 2-succinyl-6-hydroxy-2,4-cyclohexadiene-1-carboxylate synthase [Sporolactobacillus shoreicorticis]
MKAELRGVVYHYELKGSGVPLLLLHGFTGSMETWHFLEELMIKNYQLIFVDIIGHGQTDCPKDAQRYSIIEVANDLKALLDLLGLDRVHILGYSMGGRLALTFACLFPERILSLILESSSPGLKTEEERYERRLHDRNLAESICARGIHAFVDYWEQIPLFHSQKKLPMRKRAVLHNQRLSNQTTGLSNSLIGMGTGSQPSWWDHLPSLLVPVLLMTGSVDSKFCSIASEMHDRLPNAKWRVIPNAGHTVHLEQQRLFSQCVHTFVQSYIGYQGRKRK